MGEPQGRKAEPAPGTLALTRVQTVAARTSLMRARQTQASPPRTWRTAQQAEVMRQFLRHNAIYAAICSAAVIAFSVVADGWSTLLLLVFPALFGALWWGGSREMDFARDHEPRNIEVTVAPDRLRVVADGATRIDAPWSDVAVWGFAHGAQPRVPRRGRPPEVHELRLSGPDGHALTLHTHAFLDRSAIDAVTWHLCQHRRLVLDEREWVIRPS